MVVLGHPHQQPARRVMGGPAIVSTAVHAGLLVLAMLAFRHAPASDAPVAAVASSLQRIVWLADPGAGGGGGGGGNRSVTPPRQAEAPGRDRITVPVAPKPAATPAEREPIPQPTLAAVAFAAGTATLVGVVEAVSASSADSQGTGDGGGADRGNGPGVGPGHGSGLDDGQGGGANGDAYRPGNGVTSPRLIRSVRPSYTSDAMRARITGTVILACIVNAMGGVERCRTQRSLDRQFGLDDEAIRAASSWTFAPGTRQGQPVDVFVTIELSFSIQ
jgi:periplasmic protein TonB